MDNLHLNNLANDFYEKKLKLEAIMEAEKEARQLKDEAEDKLADALINAKLKKASFDGLGSFSLRRSTNWNIIDQQKLITYLQQNAPEIIKLHPQNIKGWANEIREYTESTFTAAPEEQWQEIFGMVPYDKIKITVSKAK